MEIMWSTWTYCRSLLHSARHGISRVTSDALIKKLRDLSTNVMSSKAVKQTLLWCEFLTPNSQPYWVTSHDLQWLSVTSHKMSLSLGAVTFRITFNTLMIDYVTVLPAETVAPGTERKSFCRILSGEDGPSEFPCWQSSQQESTGRHWSLRVRGKKGEQGTGNKTKPERGT